MIHDSVGKRGTDAIDVIKSVIITSPQGSTVGFQRQGIQVSQRDQGSRSGFLKGHRTLHGELGAAGLRRTPRSFSMCVLIPFHNGLMTAKGQKLAAHRP